MGRKGKTMRPPNNILIFACFLLIMIMTEVLFSQIAIDGRLLAIANHEELNGKKLDMIRNELEFLREQMVQQGPPVTNVYEMEVYGHINLVDPDGKIIKEGYKIP
jgi:hypothetical protein